MIIFLLVTSFLTLNLSELYNYVLLKLKSLVVAAKFPIDLLFLSNKDGLLGELKLE